MSSEQGSAVEQELDRLRSLNTEELRRKWQLVYHAGAPKVSRDLLILGLGYRLQEHEHGGLGRAIERKLRTMAKALLATGKVRPVSTVNFKPGARLVREWHGRTHVVTVVDGGYEHEGTTYSSLTKVAEKITRAHWSGPRFFGLPGTSSPPASDGAGRG